MTFEIIINASTPAADRRFLDLQSEHIAGRNASFRPGAGECRIKQSHDGGQTYDTIHTITGLPMACKLETFKRRIELECTGNAVIVLAL